MESSVQQIVLLIISVTLFQSNEGAQCVGTGACSCVMDDGTGTVDLTSVGSTHGDPRFKDVAAALDGFLYNYNPCQAFTYGTCNNVAVCQTDSTRTEFYNLGGQESATWSFDGVNIQIYYSSVSDVFREVFVTAVCDTLATTPIISVLGESVVHQYLIQITTACACPGGCTGGSEVGISGGSILLILAFVIILVYMVGGITNNRYRNQQSGGGLVPNRSFWGALPSLVKDGILFTVQCGKGKRTTYDQV